VIIPPRGTLSRRTLLTAGLTAGAALLAGACGSRPAAPGDAAAAAGPGGAFPRTVRHELGETAIPAAPARVVAATDGAELASLLALGVRPAGFGKRTDPLHPWTAEALAAVGGDAPSYDLSSGETNFEQLAAWGPDLLLVQEGFATDENLSSFSGIAPTVATSFIDWRAALQQVADALGRPQDAERLAADVDAGTAAARTRLAPAAGRRLAFVVSFPTGEDYLLNAASPIGKLAPQLGLAPLPDPQTEGEAVDPVSAELLGEQLADADDVAVLVFEEGDDPLARLVARPVVAGVPAVAAGRVTALSVPESNAAYFDSVLTVPLNVALLERLAQRPA
jgi:iron complex transport system substrate-binding protein